MMQAKPMLGDFEGLVFTTARMFASQVAMEEEDLRQELRIRVWRAVETYDPRKTRVPVKNYVYGCVANKVKDYKRNAARRARYGVEFEYIEEKLGLSDNPTTDAFVGDYLSVDHEYVFGEIDEGKLTLPSTISQEEAHVLLLLMFGMTRLEIQLRLAIDRQALLAAVECLRVKLADWNPGEQPGRVVELTALAA